METVLEESEIRKILPQSYPFLMIDKIIDFQKGKSLTAVKNITGDEWIFEGRETNANAFPEVLIIEIASQSALVLYQMSKIKANEECPRYVLGKTIANFKNQLKIGDQLIIEAFADKMLDNGGFSTIHIDSACKKVADIKIFYSVQRCE